MAVSEHMMSFAGRSVVDWSPDEGIKDPEETIYRISSRDGNSDLEDLFAELLKDPAVKHLTGLVIGAGDYEDHPEAMIEPLAAAHHHLPNLRALFLGDITYEESEISWIEQGDVSPLFLAYPKLEHFGVRGGNGLRLGTMQLEHLKSLIIETGGLNRSVVHDIWRSQLPALEHLEIWLGSENYGANTTVEDFAPLFTNNLFPKLRYLGLRDSEITDQLAGVLSISPLIEQIRILDLSLGTLGDQGAQALLDCPAVPKLEKLDLHHHFCTDEMIKRLLALPISVDVNEQEDAYRYGDEEEERYVAVAE